MSVWVDSVCVCGCVWPALQWWPVCCSPKKTWLKNFLLSSFLFYFNYCFVLFCFLIQYTMTVSVCVLLCVQAQNGTWSEWRWMCWMSMTMSQNGQWLLLRTWLWFPLMLLQAHWFINFTLKMVMKATMVKWITSCQMVGHFSCKSVCFFACRLWDVGGWMLVHQMFWFYQ